MVTFSNSFISVASDADIVSLTALLNGAYRGESSRKGWTTEADLIAGTVRTSQSSLKELMNLPNSVMLKYCKDGQQVAACVNLQQHQNKIYLGMLAVSPVLQGVGIGKHLLKAAEEYALQLGCTAIYMTVISVRSELIAWYKRNGYAETGQRKPFMEEEETGQHLQPLDFMLLEKNIFNKYI
jgi:ribosomal protein S18 acetylase RimI-like enzyme